MKVQIKTTEAIFPMPVLLISTFNDDGQGTFFSQTGVRYSEWPEDLDASELSQA